MELQQHLERIASESAKRHRVPGLSMAYVADDKVRWTSTFGVKRAGQGEPVSPTTIFEAASLSKPLFAYAVMMLCEQGVLELDTPLTSYTSERVVENDPRLDLITARTVLSHTTGFPNWRKGDLGINTDPGAKFGYSGEGFMYLQKVVETLTGTGLEPFMAANIMEPWGMSHSTYLFDAKNAADFGTGHDKEGVPQLKRQWSNAMSAASLHTTPSDYCKLLSHLMNSSETWVEEALKPQIRIANSVSWGLGWGLEHTKSGDWIWHWGDNGPFKAFAIASIPERTGLVTMTNGANGLLCCRDLVRECFGNDRPAMDWLFNRYGYDVPR